MQLYAGSTTEFISDAVQHRVAEKLGDAYYEYFRFRASISEFNSWQNSLTALTAQLQYSSLLDHGIILEMQLPLSSARLDALITGHDEEENAHAVIVELKQWTHADALDIDECVLTHLGGRLREVPHPSAQAAHYRQYLEDTNSAFATESAGAVALGACAWLHNLDDQSRESLHDGRYNTSLGEAPLFTGHDAMQFREFLRARLAAGNGMPVLDRVRGGRYAPSRKLMDHASAVIAGERRYTLLDEQIVAYNLILSMARKALRSKAQHAIVAVKGGPGTGKSVLAINVVGQLLKEGRLVHHVTGSKAFTENLRRVLGPRMKPLLQYSNSYVSIDPGTLDVLVMDEAHRIRDRSHSRFTPKAQRSERAQVDELVAAASVSVFFIDDHQVVRPGETGSSAMLREAAIRNDAMYLETDLRTQFRCAGCEDFIDWLDQLLEIRKTGVTRLGKLDGFDFRIFDDPNALDGAIAKVASEGASARLVAGYCWPWSDPHPDGSLVEDVQIGSFRRPWNAKPDAARLQRGIPKSNFWATDPNGIAQVGCVYTAQGFEFDYVGVIFGGDLRYNPMTNAWIGEPSASFDSIVRGRSGARFTDNVKNAYRVLMTRGMRGCFVYFVDDATREYVESHL